MTLVFIALLVAANIVFWTETVTRLPKGPSTFWERHWKLGVTILGFCVVLAALVDA